LRLSGKAVLDAPGQRLAVAQQEEQQVQHDGQADQEIEGVAGDH
jgi:hypothetical protein